MTALDRNFMVLRISDITYRYCYVVGIQTVRFGRLIVARLPVVSRAGGLIRAGGRTICVRVRRMVSDIRLFGRDCAVIGRFLRRVGNRNRLLIVPAVLYLPVMAVRRHRRLFATLLNTAAPIAAALVLTSTIRSWNNTQFVLRLEYDGERLGFISGESVFDRAAAMAQGRVINVDDAFIVSRQPKLTLQAVRDVVVLSEEDLCDKILSSSVNEVVSACGLYIDDSFQGAIAYRHDMEDMLQRILDQYASDNPDETIEFIRDVRLLDGLYPLSSLEDIEAIEQRMTATGIDGKPFLGIQRRVTEIYDEPIPYTSVTVQDATKYIGYVGVKIAGEDGVNQVTADVVYINNVEISRNVLSVVTTKKPVQEVIAKGAYKTNPNASPGQAVGTFIWPTPNGRKVYSGFGSRSGGEYHKGIDISFSGCYGTPVLAADGGRVVKAVTSGYGGGFGLHVVIDHGNGYKTLYAHMSAVLVNEGDLVAQGHQIGKIGNSGRSYGSHLHLEIQINNTPVNPLPYLK